MRPLSHRPPRRWHPRAARRGLPVVALALVHLSGTAHAQDPGKSPAEEVPAVLEVVTARGRRGDAQRLQESAEAVKVVDTRKARQETADLGEVLARTQGVGVRRDGGLGSNATISLNGLQGDQVRLFLDGVPFHLAGYPFGLANFPVNLAERVEVYRGVVPIRFGVDALGGAINVVTDPKYDTHAGASYQVGSFGVRRITANSRYRHDATGIVVGVVGFLDSARNDYRMDDRKISTPTGGTITRSLPRFNDDYRAYGANVELGVVDRKWARRFLVRAFASTYDKGLQHNALMSQPYGEVRFGETIYGASARYEVELSPSVELSLLANYANRTIDFRDMSLYRYSDWTPTPVDPVGRNGARGEIGGVAIDRSIYEDTYFARANLSWAIAPKHTARVSVTPQYVTRIGEDHVPDRVDLLGLTSTLLQSVGGAEYEVDVLEERLSNIAFAKGYFLLATHQNRPTGTLTPTVIDMETSREAWGVGDGLRYRFTKWFLGKVSYEYAARLPRPDEMFGNGVLIQSNANLRPERSHNVNVGPRAEIKRTAYGDFVLDVNGFLRETSDQIVLLAGRQFIPYVNISDARGLGLENAFSWVAPERWLTLDGSFTWQDIRNTSTSGPFAGMNGMRIPSLPYLFASWGARGRIGGLPKKEDAIEPFYHGRFTHGFYRGWDIGDPEYKTSLPSQVNHDVGVTYSMARSFARFSCTFEVDNVTNARLYDFFGVQRPGRSFNLKLVGQL